VTKEATITSFPFISIYKLHDEQLTTQHATSYRHISKHVTQVQQQTLQ